MTVSDAVNRGYNLMICAVLGLIGAAFGTLLMGEADAPDKIDDGGLLLVGIIAIVWYLMGRNRFSRGVMPIVFVVLAVAFQIAGDIIERSDPAAIGDNIGGSVITILLLIFAIVQYTRNARHLASTGTTTAA